MRQLLRFCVFIWKTCQVVFNKFSFRLINAQQERIRTYGDAAVICKQQKSVLGIKSTAESRSSAMILGNSVKTEVGGMFETFSDLKPKVEDIINESDFKSFVCKLCEYKSRLAHTMKVHIEMNHIKMRFVRKSCPYNTWCLRPRLGLPS